METKGVTCKIPLELHNQISEEIRETESTMSKFIEMVIREHYEKGANKVMEKGRTLAFQVSEELFQKVKEYLDLYEKTYHRRLTQKEFVIGLIEQALEEAEEEFEAVRASEYEEQQADEDWESGEESEGWNEESSETEESENDEEPAEGSPSESYDENPPQEDEVEIENRDENENTEPINTEETGEANENEEETYA